MAAVILGRDEEGHHAEVALGGHPQPLLRRGDGAVEPIGQHGTLLGIVEPELHCERVALAPGDTLLLYTDGVTDAPDGHAVTEDELQEIVGGSDGSPAGVIVAVEHALRARRPHGTTDDTALLVVRVTS
jgi:serine phosphatase RsbU (regulator of sigma subunit)